MKLSILLINKIFFSFVNVWRKLYNISLHGTVYAIRKHNNIVNNVNDVDPPKYTTNIYMYTHMITNVMVGM